MPDYFAVLGLPRSPWLDPELVKDRFHALGSTEHPDVQTATAGDFAEINRAYTTLADPIARLRHFLELEYPGALAVPMAIPADLVDLFTRIGAVRQAFDRFAAAESRARSPLARALLAPERQALVENLDELAAEIARARDAITAPLARCAQPSQVELVSAFQRLAFLGKWEAHLRERLTGLQMTA
jgi:curved DNA-binding protein CbpA